MHKRRVNSSFEKAYVDVSPQQQSVKYPSENNYQFQLSLQLPLQQKRRKLNEGSFNSSLQIGPTRHFSHCSPVNTQIVHSKKSAVEFPTRRTSYFEHCSLPDFPPKIYPVVSFKCQPQQCLPVLYTNPTYYGISKSKIAYSTPVDSSALFSLTPKQTITNNNNGSFMSLEKASNNIQNHLCMVTTNQHHAPTTNLNPYMIPVSATSTTRDSSVTEHLDAPEKDDQDFSILNIIPSLISEKHRKAAFVENLVDAAGLIIEVIWANFSVSPSAKIITLRAFLQETLRRSRTSYSTLQTALFYLFRIKSKITSISQRTEFLPTPTSENPPDVNNCSSQNSDPATCGRRMFLAALIIASKYLQDRNYSNRAWSKISGLPVSEINANEICFLKLIDYNLFIAEDIFKRWSSLLLTHIQAISGSDISNSDAFRKAENQREVERFRETLRSLESNTMDAKRPNIDDYPITPAVSAPGSPSRDNLYSINSY